MKTYKNFEQYYDVNPATGCWEWNHYRRPDGYGECGRDKVIWLAHRYSYYLNVNDPGDKHVLHKCDNPPCVNPDHLYLGTHKDNMHDMKLKGRANGGDWEGSRAIKVVELTTGQEFKGISHAAKALGISKYWFYTKKKHPNGYVFKKVS